MSFGIGCRLCLDPALLWLWCRPAAVALILPLAWEPPYAVGMAPIIIIIIIIIIITMKRKTAPKLKTNKQTNKQKKQKTSYPTWK